MAFLEIGWVTPCPGGNGSVCNAIARAEEHCLPAGTNVTCLTFFICFLQLWGRADLATIRTAHSNAFNLYQNAGVLLIDLLKYNFVLHV